MKKQVLALSCALALGAGAALSPATDQAAEPTAQIGYALSQYFGSTGGSSSVIQAAASSGGGHAGYLAAHTRYTGAAVRGLSARAMMTAGFRLGASVGIVGGFAGVAVGAAVGAL